MKFKLAYGVVALGLLGLISVPTASHAQANQAAENPGAAKGDTQPAGSEPPQAPSSPNSGTSSSGPIGSGPQTMPAKFDADVAARDRVPIMARPLPLSPEQKQHIYDSVMNSAQIPSVQIDATPATILPGAVELGALPSGVEEQIPAVRGYKYVKLQDKVLIVAPANRVVVGQITR
ncbi:MAG: hypothetical protein ACJ8D7_06955 [Xanthobacteraceae bacterium]